MIEAVLKEQSEFSIDLAKYLDDSVVRHPDACSVIGSNGSAMSYKELSDTADKIAAFLYRKGVVTGDRVGIFMRKNPHTLAVIFGVLRLGAAYVPIDVDSSALRASTVFGDCDVQVIFTDPESASYLIHVTSQFKSRIIVIQPNDEEMNDISEELQALEILSIKKDEGKFDYLRSTPDADRLAYILYTSGSSGTPKGVAISHRNAISFVEWASAFFNITAEDQVSSHAPFHFDLSIFDIYVSVKNGACIHLIDTDLAASPRHLATFIASREITVWYSAPAILGMLAEQRHKGLPIHNRLRLVLFAGEVFPITKLRKLMLLWTEAAYYNLYGPTETNVCTVYQVPTIIQENRLEPLSIGHPCTHCETIVVNEHLQPVPEGKSGQLCVSGDSVITGYWNDPEKTVQRIFYLNGKYWYNTGDVVRSSPEGYVFMGRLDRMIKRHGYRIELDEIESCLMTHPKLSACAVVCTEIDGEATITAFLVACDSQLSLTELRQYCHKRLARYMIPDNFSYLPALPRTSTGKTDYQFLETNCQFIETNCQFLEQQGYAK
ncbi:MULTISPECIES: amino acid adenylation domain-containing protein [Photorhabdus]|uniref:Amino acid adenylation domain-containing protein n=1 Tax=Photorhabdus luminescens TaxID=29488 RepID=A0A1G5PSD2_PHOLU|nr:amino acid adenylation domain-containing protein [Photorhabdus luminescens]SCZ51949.1 amino acid adenylation domain-containing protein [Photorhabdus luminescens]